MKMSKVEEPFVFSCGTTIQADIPDISLNKKCVVELYLDSASEPVGFCSNCNQDVQGLKTYIRIENIKPLINYLRRLDDYLAKEMK
jgi:hypothetical protein